MRYEPRPEPVPVGPARRIGGRPRINWRVVLLQAVAGSLLVWALAIALAMAFVATMDRAFVDALRISTAIVAVVVVAFGLVGVQRGPVAAGGWPGGDVTRLIRPFGMISRPSDSFLRPLRTQTREVRDREHNGLTALGVALVVVPQLVVAASLL